MFSTQSLPFNRRKTHCLRTGNYWVLLFTSYTTLKSDFYFFHIMKLLNWSHFKTENMTRGFTAHIRTSSCKNGRTSPCAAATAVEHQPMDLVKRKPGKSGSLLNGYRYRQPYELLQQTHQQQGDHLRKLQQKRDEFQYQNEPRQNSLDEAQQPQPAKVTGFQKGQQRQQLQGDCQQLKRLQGHCQQNACKLKLQQYMKKLQQCEQGETQQQNGKLQHQQHENNELQVGQRYECCHTQQQRELCLPKQDMLRELEVERTKGQQRRQQEKQCQQDKLQQEKLQEGAFYQHLMKDEVAHKEKEIASEGASTLLLLADGNHKFSKKGTKDTKIYSQVQQISTDQSESIDENPQHFQNCISSGEEGQYSVDDDRDGTLIIVDSEDSTINRQAVCIEQEANDDVDYGNEVCDRDETDTDNVEFYSVNDATLDEGEKKESNDSRRRSSSRSASQRKMDAGKQWLLMNLMEIGGVLSIIKLGEIEKSYLTYCQKKTVEPLATPVLARLIHNLFPSAEKCRLGTRGNQRIHYRNLTFKSDVNTSLQSTERHSDVPNKDQVRSSKDKQQSKGDGQILQSKLREGEYIEQRQLVQDKSPVEISDEKDRDVIGGEDNKLNELQNQDESPISPQSFSSQDDDEESCKIAANKLSEVLKWITSQSESHKKVLLRDFAHSASCQKATCVPVCMMFRRVRRHVVAAQHPCSVLRLYSKLLRHHVASCTNSKCGLPACPALRATQPTKRLLEQQQLPSKRAAVAQGPGLYRPRSLVLGPRSPLGSLPGSPVNSPPSSPEAAPLQRSPDCIVPSGQGQVQYVLVMVPVTENDNI